MSELLRLATAGSVDDGKSTLVGRLLVDTKNIMIDQYAAVERASADRGLDQADLALLTDGLRAEREQGITIDVAYRYFATPNRTFILADCPGHVQYTRNTVTGASTAQVIITLVDVRHGVVEQTRRHLAVAALLRVPHVVVAVNKIDLVDYDRGVIDEVCDQVRAVGAGLGIDELTVIPVSALLGDNVAERSDRTQWYDGPSLMAHLETVPVDGGADGPGRFPVQNVLRPQSGAGEEFRDYRGYAGRVERGSFSVGDEVRVLPGGQRTTVTGVDLPGGGSGRTAGVSESVTLRLADDIDIARGELIATEPVPEPVRRLDALVCWLGDRPLRTGDRLLVKHTTRTVTGMVTAIGGRLDLSSFEEEAADELGLNDIGRISLTLADPICPDPYADSRATGSFILIHPQEGGTLAAGMVA
ncbi:sulfate adenylyltransferase subunit 1 [Propionibacterium australiense]|uniref:sulfate adenylyltransferase n=1 Tax=Propionibacterium australiense TaxID=119981 RepID=A0A8B3FUX1_9ACTN|nr:GTP-binding protein [Propionibacterium australiense]RLP11002.1 sulfate adenylyltransferase [Propionibacterium australiense]RLP13032.1 sulfate adenylyltransferase [Propionibacterium australiense]VEH90989.1 Bifunctional enzyme CysN/CysC [Propionibacterium australiense]